MGGGGEREGGGEGEDRKGEGNINFGHIPQNTQQNSSKQRSVPSLCSTVVDTRSHTCILIIHTHTENIYCSQETSRNGG